MGTSRINIALKMPSMCGDRPGWKSSQAVVTSSGTRAVPSLERNVHMVYNSRPGAVPSLERRSSKVNKVQGEGGSCVNTHTGAVRVAASQGNIVFTGSGGESSSVNTHTGDVRVAASQSNIVYEAYHSVNMKHGPGPMKKYEQSVCLNGMCRKCAKCTNMVARVPKSDTNIKKNKHTVAKLGLSSKESLNPPLPSTLRLREYFQQFAANTNFMGKGSKEITPTKRKLIDSGCVTNLKKSFDVAADNVPGESKCLESPAKRQRRSTGVKHLAS